MVTPYGKELRKMRIDRGEILNTMAEKLEISPAYLSSIENSMRPIPTGFSAKIIDAYKLSAVDAKKLVNAEDETLKAVEIKLSTNLNGTRRQTALMFARSFNNISDAELEKIREILSGGEENDS